MIGFWQSLLICPGSLQLWHIIFLPVGIVVVVVLVRSIPRLELQIGLGFTCLNPFSFLIGSLPSVLLDILIIIFKSDGCIQQLLKSLFLGQPQLHLYKWI